MHNQQLVDYIKIQLAQGVGSATIRQTLIGQGWAGADVEAALLSMMPAEKTRPAEKKKSLFSWKNKSLSDDVAFAPNEEIDARRTSMLGYFFLILMVIFGIWQGNNFLSALEDSIDAPEQNSNCLSVLDSYAQTNSYNSYDSYYYNNSSDQICTWSEREKQLGLDTAYKGFLPTLTEIDGVEKNISDLNAQISNRTYNRNQTVGDYEIALLESIAKTEGRAFDRATLLTGVISQDEYIANLRAVLGRETTRKTTLVEKAKEFAAGYRDSIQKAKDAYAHDYVVFQLKQFLLSLLFTAPILYFAWRRYHASKEARSEYAIIWGGILATISLLFAQILFVFVYQILPHEILQKVFAILAQMKFLWALLYWLGFILVPLFFAYLIYLIQKKFYNKRAVMMRALKSGHCGRCSLKIDPSMNHCPVCGNALKTKCVSCGAMSTSGGAFCDACGVKKG